LELLLSLRQLLPLMRLLQLLVLPQLASLLLLLVLLVSLVQRTRQVLLSQLLLLLPAALVLQQSLLLRLTPGEAHSALLAAQGPSVHTLPIHQQGLCCDAHVLHAAAAAGWAAMQLQLLVQHGLQLQRQLLAVLQRYWQQELLQLLPVLAAACWTELQLQLLQGY
jgi:hypothetical protein